MTFSQRKIEAALGSASFPDEGKFFLPEVNFEQRVAVGLDHRGNYIFVIPASGLDQRFADGGVSVDYMDDLSDIRSGEEIHEVIVFSCPNSQVSRDAFGAFVSTLVGVQQLVEDGDSRSAHEVLISLAHLVVKGVLQRPDDRPLTGLVGELMTIATSKNPRRMIEAWHRETTEAFDFSEASVRIEVKSTIGRNRRHTFSMNQLPRSTEAAFVISVLISRASGGQSLAELVDEVRANLSEDDSELDERFVRQVNETLRRPYQLVNDYCIDRQTTASSIRLYTFESVPKVHPDPGVIEANWTTLMSNEQQPLEDQVGIAGLIYRN